MAIYLGIDGGGSKTSSLVGDGQRLLGSGSSEGSNVVRVGEARARQALHSAIRQACDAAKIVPAQVQNTVIGMAGAGRPEVRQLVQQMAREILGGIVRVVGDMEIAMSAAFGDGPGVIVVAGTGSIAFGRNLVGQTARAGGWGFAISDEGSGHWIGRAAIAGTFRALDQDRGENTPLLEVLCKCWGLATHEQLVLAANATPAPDFAGLFPVVVSASESGDPIALSILTQAGRELASLAATVVRRLFPDPSSARVAMAGGVFRHSSTVRQVFYNQLQAENSGITIAEEVVEPVRGALELARRSIGSIGVPDSLCDLNLQCLLTIPRRQSPHPVTIFLWK